MTLLHKVISQLAKPAPDPAPAESEPADGILQPRAVAAAAADEAAAAARSVPRTPPSVCPAQPARASSVPRKDAPPNTCLKFAPLPKPSLGEASQRDHVHVLDGAAVDADADDGHVLGVKSAATATKDNKHRAMTVDTKPVSPSSPLASSPRFESEYDAHGGDTEEIWYGEGSRPNDSTHVSSGDEDNSAANSSKKAFRCLASRPRSPLHSSPGSMAFSNSTSFGAIMSPTLSDAQTSPDLDDHDGDTQLHKGVTVAAASVNNDQVNDDVDQDGGPHAESDQEHDNDEEQEEEEEEEEEEEKHEAALARSRSTSRAAGVEKFHKHYRPESSSVTAS